MKAIVSGAWGKWVGLAIVLVLLIAGLDQVQTLVQERQEQRHAATASVARSA